MADHPVWRCERLGWRGAGFSPPQIRPEELRTLLQREMIRPGLSTSDLGIRLIEVSGVSACDVANGSATLVDPAVLGPAERAHSVAHALLLRWGRPHSETDVLHLAYDLLELMRGQF